MGNRPHLLRQIRRHDVDTIRQVFPGSSDAWHSGLTTQSSISSDFSSHSSDFRGEGSKRFHHVVDSVLAVSAARSSDLNAHFQLQNFSKCFDVDLFTQITSGDRSSATSQQGGLEDGKFAKLTLQPNFGLGLSSSKPAREKEPDQYRGSLTIKLTLSVKTIHVPSTFGT